MTGTMFGFWRYLSSAAHEKTLWVPASTAPSRRAPTAPPTSTDPSAACTTCGTEWSIEPLLTTDVAARLADLLGLGARLGPGLGQHLLAASRLSNLLAIRP